MTEPSFGRRWVLVAEAEDRPGSLNAISAVFASRGVNFETTIASVEAAEAIGSIVGVFRTGERRARLLQRTVERLDHVRRARVLPDDDPSVRGVGFLRHPDGTAVDWRPGDAVAATWTGDGSSERPLVVEASLATLLGVFDDARRSGLRASLGAVHVL